MKRLFWPSLRNDIEWVIEVELHYFSGKDLKVSSETTRSLRQPLEKSEGGKFSMADVADSSPG
jgi:hypothetical protein